MEVRGTIISPPTQLEQLIQGIPVAQLTRLFDSFVWPQNNGVCSVHSTLKFLYQQANIPFEKKKLLELDLETTMPQKNPNFYLNIHVQSVAYSSISSIYLPGN